MMILSPLDQDGPLFGSTKYLREQSNILGADWPKPPLDMLESKTVHKKK